MKKGGFCMEPAFDAQQAAYLAQHDEAKELLEAHSPKEGDGAGILTRFNRFKQREVPAKHCDMGERHHAALLGNGERPGPELRQFVLRDGGSAVCVDKG